MILKKRIIIAAFMVLLIGVGLLVYFGQQTAQKGELYYSGTIEATQANLAFQTSGRVQSVFVREGQAVLKDQALAELESAELASRLEQARANLDKSLKSQRQSETMLDLYNHTLPAEVARAEAGLASARFVLEDARKDDQRYEQLFQKGVASEKERDKIKLQYDTAVARLAEAEAILNSARSNLKKIDAARQDAAAAVSQVQAVRATLQQAEIQRQYALLKAPMGGVMTSRNVEPGEVVSPGREVLTLSDLSRVDLKIFVDETAIGKVRPGQKADVRIDTFPDKVYAGHVAFVSPEGEFTPKIIQTKKERVKLVYLVKISIPNPNYELKSGMPADAWLR
ncbi:MAG: hemolysin secretion protein D [Syntrophus sp. (in: bacteria)]|nr:hemolysin secretion protein D [Syntrophus sp. (in: bacteria)]